MEQKPEENQWVQEIVRVAQMTPEELKEAIEEGTAFSTRKFFKLPAPAMEDLEEIYEIARKIALKRAIDEKLLSALLEIYNEVQPGIALKLRPIIYGLLRTYKGLPTSSQEFANNVAKRLDEIYLERKFEGRVQAEQRGFGGGPRAL